MVRLSDFKIYLSAMALLLPVAYIHYGIQREQFTLLMVLYAVAFAGFMGLYYSANDQSRMNLAISIGFIGRIMLLFGLPVLSNDFYRFIWDGRMMAMGINPYLVLPESIPETETYSRVGEDAEALYRGMGALSSGNYTCYPPVNQFVFALVAFISPESIAGSVILMRILIILSEAGTFFYGRKVLNRLGLPESNILLYFINPFIILELTGNLHFEAVTIFFLVIALYTLLRNKFINSAIWLSIAVSVKLIPLIFLPLFAKKLGSKNWIKYLLVVLLVNVLLFAPFISQGLAENFFSSLDLYFRKFEFNAGIYYLIRWIGFETRGWNIIQTAGTVLGMLVFAFVWVLAFAGKNSNNKTLIVSMLFAISVYYLLSTTVHPWYLAIPLILSVFTRYRFVLLWSLLVMLSYYAYSQPDYRENMLVIVLEYIPVYGMLFLELFGVRFFCNKTAMRLP